MRHTGGTAQASDPVLAGRNGCRSGWLVRAATCVVLVLGSAIAMGSQASATGTTGSISGTVTAAVGGGDVSGICVDALTSDGTLTVVGSAATAADGTYAISGLSPASYDVEFSVAGCGTTGSYLTQWYNNATSSSTAHVVPVTAGTTTPSINAALISGAIAGTVTAASGGADLGGICVDVQQTGGAGFGSATTSVDGTYTVTGLKSGSYSVEFFTGCGNSGNYLTQWYNGQATETSAVPVTVVNGVTTPTINAALITGGSISGTVTAAANGADLNGICVQASQFNGAGLETATTSANGSYSISGLGSGQYSVQFSPNCGNGQNLLTQWYNDKTSAIAADPVPVTAGTTTPSINAAMQIPGTITGTVTAANGGAQLSGICVSVSQVNGSGGGSATTGAGGTYSVSGLETGTYKVGFSSCGNSGNYLDQWYDNETTAAAADSVSVTATKTTSSINAALAAGGTIAGTVTAATGGADLAGICVSAFTSNDSLSPAGNTTTAADGSYSIAGLSTGNYDIEFSTGCGNTGNYLTQWYNNETSLSSANAVAVISGATSSTIDASLVTGGTIAGTVTAKSGGADLDRICVSVYTSDNSFTLVGSTTTAADGTYSISDLSSGNYDVEFSGGCGYPGNVGQQWYDNQISQSAASAVNVTAGSTTSVNATLTIGGTITGTVTAAIGGAGQGGMCVSAYAAGDFQLRLASAVTAADGTYALTDLATGSYDVEFTSGCGGSPLFGQQWYNGNSSESASMAIPVTTGVTTTSINATLIVGGSISGTVTVSSGSDFSGICVDAFAPGDFLSPSGSTTTASDGSYSLTNLAPGNYDVEFSAGCGISENVGQQWYNTKASQSSANVVAVTAGGSTSAINGTLSLGGTITGTVTAAAGGADVSGVCVVAFAPGDVQLSPASTTTASDGSYALTNLAPGSYQVEFTSGCGASVSYATQWYSASPTAALAVPVVVTALTTTPSINAAMALGVPSVAGINPTSGPTAGGTSVTINGANLSSASAVNFGATLGIITADSATSITATSPAESAGTVDVTVTTPGGPSATSSADNFTYVTAPSVTGVIPNSGPTAGGTSVTVSGTNLSGATSESFGASSGVITADSTTSITATAPPGGARTVDITVTTAGGISATSVADRFTYVAPPTVTAINPTGGSVAGGTTVTITGTSLSSASGVKFGTTAGTITANSAASVTATAPAETAGTVDVTVTTLAGTSALSSADRFTYAAAPTVTALNPTSGSVTGGTAVTIAGTNLSGATAVRFGTTAGSVTADSATSITATTPAEVAGTVDVTVTTAGGTSAASSADHYTFAAAPPPAPTVVGINPLSGPTAGGTAVTITGTNLSGATSVSFGSSSGVITADSASSITATAPAEAAATVDVTVTTPGGTSGASSADHYTFVAPLSPGAPFSPLAPVRICDTRAGNPSGLSAPANQCNGQTIPKAGTMGVNVAGSFGVPANATAVVLNVTVVNPSAPGIVTAYPTGAVLPVASNINYVAGEVVPNLVEVGIGSGGDVSFYSSSQSDLVVDVEGYTAPSASGGAGAGLYNALPSPVRICDTRAGNPSNLNQAPINQCNGVANRGETLPAGGSVAVGVAGNASGIPSGATAAVFNVTVANPRAAGILTVYPEDTTRPAATSNVNYGAGQVTTNRVIVPLSTTGAMPGDITVYSSVAADVIVDVSGYYSAANGSGSQFSAEAAPVRICDTRAPSPSSPANQCSNQPIASGALLNLTIRGLAGVPQGATAVVVNLTGIQPTQPTFLTVFPGGPTVPVSSDLNPAVGEIRANMVVATINPGTGHISIFNLAGTIGVVVDVLGWYS
jgi:IPT/TIG domain/Carboxypeptidase regulatory-like domain